MSPLPSLPPVEATDDEVRAWVRAAMQAVDAVPRRKNWRFRALGCSYGEAMADAPRTGRVGLEIPVGEMRILRELAAERGIGVETLVRRALATWMSAIGDVDPDSIPTLARGGILGR